VPHATRPCRRRARPAPVPLPRPRAPALVRSGPAADRPRARAATRRPRTAARVVRAVGHGDATQVAEVGEELGQVEERRDRFTPARLAGEREVADRDAVSACRVDHGRETSEAVAAPRRPVDDEAIGHPEHVRGDPASERRLAGPPDRHGQIVDEQRRDDCGDVQSRLPAGGQVDRLRAYLRGPLAREHAVRTDLRVEPRRPVGIGRGQDQRPRGVAPRQLRDDRGRMLADLGSTRDDHEVHHARPRGDVALLVAVDVLRELRGRPDLHELALDLLDRVRTCRKPEHRRARGGVGGRLEHRRVRH
jgi:hypothetical protein